MKRLVGRLELFARERDKAVTVVFDGRPHAEVVAAAEAVEVSFAGPGRDAADHEIARLVRAAVEPAAVLVVSSDRRLQAAVKAAGGARIGAGEFLASLRPAPPPGAPGSRE